jgi:hypothetical protein
LKKSAQKLLWAGPQASAHPWHCEAAEAAAAIPLPGLTTGPAQSKPRCSAKTEHQRLYIIKEESTIFLACKNIRWFGAGSLIHWGGKFDPPAAQFIKVFLVLFLQKKNRFRAALKHSQPSSSA